MVFTLCAFFSLYYTDYIWQEEISHAEWWSGGYYYDGIHSLLEIYDETNRSSIYLAHSKKKNTEHARFNCVRMRKTAAMVSRVLAGAGEGYRDFSQQLQCAIMYYATYFISWTVISLFFFYTSKRNYDNDFHHHPENIDHQSTPPSK